MGGRHMLSHLIMTTPRKQFESLYFIFHDHMLYFSLSDKKLVLPADNPFYKNDSIFLGNYQQKKCYLINAISTENNENSGAFISFKEALEHIGLDWFPVAARAYQILLWNNNHQFCGACGKKTKKGKEKLEKRCDRCHLSFFPKISPAVIVMVKRANKILLARQSQFPKGIYALIAGFMEPGETAEEAVHREVMEESGIEINNIVYAGSQPWPFPDSLMLAFIADYKSGEIILNDGELEHADWYDANNLPGFPSSSISIARKMIDDFIISHKKT